MVRGINAGEARADDQDVKMFRGCCQGLVLKNANGWKEHNTESLTADSTGDRRDRRHRA
jgi:hypothetical protein